MSMYRERREVACVWVNGDRILEVCALLLSLGAVTGPLCTTLLPVVVSLVTQLYYCILSTPVYEQLVVSIASAVLYHRRC